MENNDFYKLHDTIIKEIEEKYNQLKNIQEDHG